MRAAARRSRNPPGENWDERHADAWGRNCRYGQAPAVAASRPAHDGSRQRGTACPLLYRYRLTHAYCSLACPLLTLSSKACPFSNGIFRSNGAPASLPLASSSLTHTRRMDGFCNQNADQLGSFAGLSFPAVYDDDRPFIVLTETKFSLRCIPVWIGTLLTGLGSKKTHVIMFSP
jgi:hypothetical protein